MPILSKTNELSMAEDFGLIGIAQITGMKTGSLRVKLEDYEGKAGDGTFWITKAACLNWDSIRGELMLCGLLDEEEAMAAREPHRYVVPASVETLIVKRWWAEDNGLLNEEEE